MKKIISFLLSITIIMSILGIVTVSASDEISVYLDGELLTFDTAPQIIDGRTMVPMRGIFETFGTTVQWDERYQRIIVTGRGSWTYVLEIGEYQIEYLHPTMGMEDETHGFVFEMVLEGRIEIDVAPQIVDGRTLVPLRAVSEVFGAGVQWNSDTRTVTIATQQQQQQQQQGPLSFESALLNAMPTDENFMISPFSLRMALAMVANGASGESRAEILEVLGIYDLDAFNRSSAAFIASANANDQVEFNIANSIWLNEDRFPGSGVDFSEEYKRIISDYFAGVAERVGSEDGVDRINAWISEQTMDRINNVLPDDTFDKDKRILAVLVNTIYFNANWQSAFMKDNTRNDIFTDRNGVESTLEFMEARRWFSFYENEHFQMLAKPYMDNDIRMYFVLPGVGERLPFSMFEDAIGNMAMQNVRFRLPRFSTETLHENLVGTLQEMGIIRAFEEGHFDFQGMVYPTIVRGEDIFLWIDDIIQKTFIEVDEDGTEAAAATVVTVGAEVTSVPPPPIPFYCDRPFIYFIRNDVTGDILFMGEFAFAQ